jgi:hypothetical protein
LWYGNLLQALRQSNDRICPNTYSSLSLSLFTVGVGTLQHVSFDDVVRAMFSFISTIRKKENYSIDLLGLKMDFCCL